ncbi:hypothetical protein [Geobacter sp. SVR]|uniref:hypothetical protein n=1 Tax=Geobacter sp. SVR TaxID=2495594 RepID=UPI00143EFD78|nr:hypothetical protein [Geobacter sp. SVR]BCS54101.1 hypothetical protein GSVR_24090 [Geobacter sp. SVR]GCF87584.1 hypothetical protein GSbR_41840 [Geobacter sp. SVR]
MDDRLYAFAKALGTLRRAVGKDDIPAVWLEFFIAVVQHGEAGVTTQELIGELGMSQGNASRIVKILSRFYNHHKKESDGLDLIVTAPDPHYRHRQRLFVSEHGKAVVAELKK